MMLQRHSHRLLMTLVLSLLALTVTPAFASEAGSPSGTTLSIQDWVERLGSPSYATRSRAKEMLERLGLEAFDSLHQAQFHPDSEIAMSARHLVSSLMVSWSKESDPAAVRDALADYGAQSEVERTSRMELLGELADREGLEALVRLTRFETSLRLSRQAALLLMQQPMSDDETRRRRESEIVLEVLGENDRQAADWLRVYASDLASGEYSSDKWRELINDQRRDVDATAIQQTSRATVLELIRVCASRAATLGERDEAIKLASEHLDLIPPTTRDLIDACSWAIDHELHSLVLELRQLHARMFEQQPVLLYNAAEALISTGKVEEAERLASQALSVNSLPNASSTDGPRDDDTKQVISPRQAEEIAQTHLEIGKELQDKGLFRWAEREYQQIIDSLEVTSLPSAVARTQLAAMLAELLRHREVVATLEPLQQRIDSDDQFANRLRSRYVPYMSIPSVLEYHRGLADVAAGDFAAAQPKFLKAFELDDENVDILISMYRLEGDDAWRSQVMTLLQRQIRISENDVQQKRSQSRNFGGIITAELDLAQSLNGYAWLVSNTEGDQQLALQNSLQSLKIVPTSEAMMDTCARCYFAVGDIENAVRMQRRAIKSLPHSPPLLRQLEQFEKALAE